MLALCLLFLLTVNRSLCHFQLLSPPSVGFDDETEAQAPCGGPAVDFSSSNVTDFHVNGDSIAVRSTHPAANWLFRATLDQTATKGNWTNLLPAVNETGLGAFCETGVKVPAEWAGQKGVVSVVQEGDDGMLYQCSAVNFVNGTAAVPTQCTNATGLKASFTDDPKFSSLPATASATGSAPPASSSKSSGSTIITSWGAVESMVGVVMIATATLSSMWLL